MLKPSWFRDQKKIVVLFAILALAYIALTLFAPTDQNALNKYNLSSAEARVLSLTIVLPSIFIWGVAANGYVRLKNYSSLIIKSKDGKALSKIATGLLILALWLPITAIISSASRFFIDNDPNFQPSSVIIANYAHVIILSSAFYFIYQGASKLPAILKKYGFSNNGQSIFWTIFILLGSAFTFLTLANPSRETPQDGVSIATYYLTDWLIILTIIIPYLLILFFGLRSVAYIFSFSVNVPGQLYKTALRFLAIGIFLAVTSIISIRIIASQTAWFEKQELKAILAVIYLLLLFIGVGYAYIAKGAKKLQKIEEA